MGGDGARKSGFVLVAFDELALFDKDEEAAIVEWGEDFCLRDCASFGLAGEAEDVARIRLTWEVGAGAEGEVFGELEVLLYGRFVEGLAFGYCGGDFFAGGFDSGGESFSGLLVDEVSLGDFFGFFESHLGGLYGFCLLYTSPSPRDRG